jgi:hypothetical protein
VTLGVRVRQGPVPVDGGVYRTFPRAEVAESNTPSHSSWEFEIENRPCSMGTGRSMKLVVCLVPPYETGLPPPHSNVAGPVFSSISTIWPDSEMTNEMVPPEMPGADPRGPENVVLGMGVTGIPAEVAGATGVTTGAGVGVTSAVAVGTNAGGVSGAGVADGRTTGEHATSSPASAQPVNIPVLVLARIGQFLWTPRRCGDCGL